MTDEKIDGSTIIDCLLQHSVDATQTAFADKGIPVSERTVYKWKNMLENLSSPEPETTPLMRFENLVKEIHDHQTQYTDSTSSSDDDSATNKRTTWKMLKQKIISVVNSSFRPKRTNSDTTTLLPPSV
jgi:hypothetical protein